MQAPARSPMFSVRPRTRLLKRGSRGGRGGGDRREIPPVRSSGVGNMSAAHLARDDRRPGSGGSVAKPAPSRSGLFLQTPISSTRARRLGIANATASSGPRPARSRLAGDARVRELGEQPLELVPPRTTRRMRRDRRGLPRQQTRPSANSTAASPPGRIVPVSVPPRARSRCAADRPRTDLATTTPAARMRRARWERSRSPFETYGLSADAEQEVGAIDVRDRHRPLAP